MGGAGDGLARIFVTVGGGTGFDLREVFLDAKDINKEALTDAEYLKPLKPGGRSFLTKTRYLKTLKRKRKQMLILPTEKTMTWGTL